MNAVTDPAEAFFVAYEMERRAVRLYERALLVFDRTPLEALMKEILSDEREHLRRFLDLGAKTPFDCENTALLSAESAQIIFSGGLTEAHRLGAFESKEKLLSYACGQERSAISTYEGFAAQMDAQDARAQAFLCIAEEEKKHLRSLEAQLLAAAQKE